MSQPVMFTSSNFQNTDNKSKFFILILYVHIHKYVCTYYICSTRCYVGCVVVTVYEVYY